MRFIKPKQVLERQQGIFARITNESLRFHCSVQTLIDSSSSDRLVDVKRIFCFLPPASQRAQHSLAEKAGICAVWPMGDRLTAQPPPSEDL